LSTSEDELSLREQQLVTLHAERDRLRESLTTLLRSRPWRWRRKLHRLRQRLAPAGTWRGRWFWLVADVVLRRPAHLRGQPGPGVPTNETTALSPAAALRSILDQTCGRRGVVVHPSSVDWGWLKQRPHHLLAEFARAGYLVFFCPPQTQTDVVPLFTRVAERLYLCGSIEWLYGLSDPILLVSKPRDDEHVRRFREPTVIYDYLDDLAVHTRGGRVRTHDHRRHERLLQTATVVSATSETLLRAARRTRADALLCPNAVDFEHFDLRHAPAPPPDLAPLLGEGRPLIGYYGALAYWFDFDLLSTVAAQRPQYRFVLVGPDYDGTLGALLPRLPANVRWLGEKTYEDLPAYLYHFAVATIPFRVNEVTRATSPLKLFEYFAAGKPVVTTELPECARHADVLTAADAGAFAARLDEALRRKDDPQFRDRLREVARANSWSARFATLHARLVPERMCAVHDVLARVAAREGVVIFPRSIDWNVDLFQRPHHLARGLARAGWLAIYVGGPRDGHFAGFREIEPNLYVFRGPDEILHQIPHPWLWCFCYNFHAKDTFPPNTTVVYDLIDEPRVHPFGRRFLMRNHRRALREATLVTCVARALERLLAPRPDALYLPNGVENEHFAADSLPRPDDAELRDLLRDDKPVAGYYGALAMWFDCDLLDQVAVRRPDWRFLLIGPDYDGTVLRHRLLQRPNVLRLGPRPYAALPAYLQLFDVAMIPFRLNRVTRATSPLKLFEYFAGGKPVITTPLPECQAFAEVYVVDGVERFCAALDDARAAGQDPAYRRRLQEIAGRHSWQQRVETVLVRLRTSPGNMPAVSGTPGRA